jgi:hypothetical protein
MSEAQLRQMITYASGFCVREFRKRGVVGAMYHIVTENGDSHIMPPPQVGDKDLALAMMRALFEVAHVVRYIFVDEAWMLIAAEHGSVTSADMLHMQVHGVRSHPDRTEVVMISGEDYECGQLLCWRRIYRPTDKRPYLGPLEEMPNREGGTTEGRMIGLLPARGPMQ